MYGHFKRQTSEVSDEKTSTWLRKGHLKRETESLLLATQNNAIETNDIKAKIDKTLLISKCRLYGDTDEKKKQLHNEQILQISAERV